MAEKTLAIDVQDQTVRPTNPINIAVINKPNIVKGYNATYNQIKQLIQLSRYWIFEAGTRNPVTAENIYDYVTEYEKNTEYPRGRIVYVDPGQLYQANQDFTSNNDLGKTVKESFMSDISAGYLDAVTDAEIGDLGQRVEVLEEKIIDAEEVEFYDSISEFPQTGAVDIIYVDNTTGKSYTWNTTTSEYDIMNTNNIIPGSVLRCTL